MECNFSTEEKFSKNENEEKWSLNIEEEKAQENHITRNDKILKNKKIKTKRGDFIKRTNSNQIEKVLLLQDNKSKDELCKEKEDMEEESMKLEKDHLKENQENDISEIENYSLLENSKIYDEHSNIFSYLNEDDEHEILAPIPHRMRKAFLKTLSFWGLERHIQLLRLIQLLGDAESGYSIPFIQVVGLAGMAKTGLIKDFLQNLKDLKNFVSVYINCAVANYQGVRGAREVIYEKILKQVSEVVKAKIHEIQANLNKNEKRTINDSSLNFMNIWKVSRPDEFVRNLRSLLYLLKTWKIKSNKRKRISNKINRINEDSTNKDSQKIVNFNTNKTKLIIVLDNVKHLAKFHPHILLTLLRLKECLKDHKFIYRLLDENKVGQEDIISVENSNEEEDLEEISLTTIIVNRSPLSEECLHGVSQPPAIWFDSYTKDMCRNILLRSFYTLAIPTLKVSLPPNVLFMEAESVEEEKKWEGKFCLKFLSKKSNFYEEFKKINNFDSEVNREESEQEDIYVTDLKALWRVYIDEFLCIMYKTLKSDFHELRFSCRQLWTVFIQPVLAGKVRLFLQDMGILKRAAGPHFAKALRNHCSHYLPDLRDSTLLDFSADSEIKAARIELPYWSKVLLFAAFLVSQNSQKSDKRFFNHFVGKVFHVAKPRKNYEDRANLERKGGLLGVYFSAPRPFSFSRWICIADCLSMFLQSTSLEFNYFLFDQISSLLRVGFIRIFNTSNISGRNNELNNLSNLKQASSIPMLSTMNFAYRNNYNNSNLFLRRNNCSPQLVHVFDFDCKLIFQTSFDLIEEISKDLNIPLEDALLF